jgi:hypothetical protein
MRPVVDDERLQREADHDAERLANTGSASGAGVGTLADPADRITEDVFKRGHPGVPRDISESRVTADDRRTDMADVTAEDLPEAEVVRLADDADHMADGTDEEG